jgi:hypothetical protein
MYSELPTGAKSKAICSLAAFLAPTFERVPNRKMAGFV